MVHIGAVDWAHTAWCGSFYPHDLPEDWRLLYYANEFSTVLVPPSRWLAADDQEARRWSEDLPGHFRLFLQLGGRQLGRPGVWHRLGRFAQRAAGVIVVGRAHATTLDRVFQALPRVQCALVPAEPGAGPPFRRCTNLGGGGPVAIADGGVCPLPRLRQRLEGLLANCASAEEGYLFLDGDPPQISTLRNAVTIADLFGNH